MRESGWGESVSAYDSAILRTPRTPPGSHSFSCSCSDFGGTRRRARAGGGAGARTAAAQALLPTFATLTPSTSEPFLLVGHVAQRLAAHEPAHVVQHHGEVTLGDARRVAGD